jgi:23S rRNA (uracil1939-C5)-methyltransferase
LHEHLARARIEAAGRDRRGVLRHLLVRTTADEREAVAMLVVTRNEKSLRAPIKKFLASSERPTGFFLNIHDRPGPFMIGRETLKLDGHAHVREQVAGVSFLVSPTAFFQTNVHAAAVLVDLVLAHAAGASSRHIADLYCGSGLFALSLAARGHRVTAVEENAQAVKDAEANVRLNRLPAERLRFIAARVEDAIARLEKTAFDLVVIDPPRAGCPDAVLRTLFARGGPSEVCYVSCNPEALARELPLVLEQGYEVRRVQPVDMFPHTTHIETVVSLGR